MALAASGAEVLLAARGRTALEDTAAWCGPLARVLPTDLAAESSVDALVEAVKAHLGTRPLVGMVLAAGVMRWDSPVTASGWSLVPLVNALSPWRLLQGLESRLLAAPGGRVLLVAGAPFTLQGVLPELEGWKGNQKGRGLRLALEAAAAKVWMARSLHRRWGGRAAAFAFHPGFVKSHLADGLPFPLNTLGCMAQGLLSTRCRTGEWLALDPKAPALSGQLVAGTRGFPLCPSPEAAEAEDRWLSQLLL